MPSTSKNNPTKGHAGRETAATEDRSDRWWGRFAVPQGAGGFWCVGPFRLWVQRRSGEWDVNVDTQDDPMTEGLVIEVPVDATAPPEAAPVDATRWRFGSQDAEDAFFVTPLLADRSVVARPESPFYLLGKHEVAMYVSHPVWVRLEAGDPPGELLEMPTFQPSDTWLGASTRQGELCYAVRTSARLTLEGFPFRVARAVTELRIRNRAATPLAFERVSIPAPNLSLYHDGEGRLWTEAVTVEREEAGETAHVRIGRVPRAASEPLLISKPRQPISRNVLSRAMGMLFG